MADIIAACVLLEAAHVMSSIMRARNGLTGRSEVSKVIGALSRAEGCWTFDARDRMPPPSRATACHLVENAPTATPAPSRERVRSSTQSCRSFRSIPLGAVAPFAAIAAATGGEVSWRPRRSRSDRLRHRQEIAFEAAASGTCRAGVAPRLLLSKIAMLRFGTAQSLTHG